MALDDFKDGTLFVTHRADGSTLEITKERLQELIAKLAKAGVHHIDTLDSIVDANTCDTTTAH